MVISGVLLHFSKVHIVLITVVGAWIVEKDIILWKLVPTFPSFSVVFFVEAKFGSVFSLHEHGDDICIIILEYILRYIITNGIIIISTMLYITNDS